jgi:DNA-binding transcriptional ArsR family regulator
MPCHGPYPEPKAPIRISEHAPLIRNVQRRQVSGAERVQAIERLAATRLGVRELGRRTGFAPSTISRWLKIDRCPPLKRALQTEVVDIGRAKLLADAPENALAELIPVAAAVSRADLARRIAALRGQQAPEPCVVFGASPDSQRLARAVRLVESVTLVEANDRLSLQRLQTLVDGLLASQATSAFPKTCAEHTSF